MQFDPSKLPPPSSNESQQPAPSSGPTEAPATRETPPPFTAQQLDSSSSSVVGRISSLKSIVPAPVSIPPRNVSGTTGSSSSLSIDTRPSSRLSTSSSLGPPSTPREPMTPRSPRTPMSSAAESPIGPPSSPSSYRARTDEDRQLDGDDFKLISLLQEKESTKDNQTVSFLILSCLMDTHLEHGDRIYIISNPFDEKLGTSSITKENVTELVSTPQQLSQLLNGANFVLMPRALLEGQVKVQNKKESSSSLGNIFSRMFNKQKDTTTPSTPSTPKTPMASRLTTDYVLLVVPNWLVKPFNNAQEGQLEVDPKRKLTVRDNTTFSQLMPHTVKGTNDIVFAANVTLPQVHHLSRQSPFLFAVVKLKIMMHIYCEEMRNKMREPHLQKVIQVLVELGYPRVIAEIIAMLSLSEALQGNMYRPGSSALPPIGEGEGEDEVGGEKGDKKIEKGVGKEEGDRRVEYDEKKGGIEKEIAEKLKMSVEELQRLKTLNLSLDREGPSEPSSSSSSSLPGHQPSIVSPELGPIYPLSPPNTTQSASAPTKAPEPEPEHEIHFTDDGKEAVHIYKKPAEKPESADGPPENK